MGEAAGSLETAATVEKSLQTECTGSMTVVGRHTNTAGLASKPGIWRVLYALVAQQEHAASHGTWTGLFTDGMAA
jgi:hypothetical protein